MKKFTTCLLVLLLMLCGGTALAAEEAVASPPRVDSGVAPDMVVPEVTDTQQPNQPADTLSKELARITQSVKTTLAIDDSYTEFYGEQTERGYGVSWYLNWSNAEGNLTVEVDKDGQITSYYRYTYNERYYNDDFAPIFPQTQRVQAQKVAEDFASRVLGAGETAVFQDDSPSLMQPREQSRYYLSGNISINGVPSPLSISITVNAADMSVSSFWRDTLNTSYVGEIPSPTPKIASVAAQTKLAPLQKFTLAYYRSDENAKEARLQYRPVQDNTYYVDAQNGQLLDMNKLYEEAQDKTVDRGISGGGEGMKNTMATADAAAAPQAVKLSPTEQAGVEKMEGLLTREQLDAKLRAISEFGLGKEYILSNVNYRQESYNGESTYVAHLEYYAESNARSLGISEKDFKQLKDEGQKLYTNKYATVNAATGELQSLSTYRPYVNELLITAKKQDYKKEAEAFLQRYCGDKFAQTALRQEELGSAGIINDSNYLRYVQQVNGYDFAENNISVSANPFTGEIERFSTYGWQDGITFATAEGIISEAQARELYVDSLECRLVYRGLPQAIDPSNPQMKPLMEYGYSMVYRLALVYSMEAEYPHNVYAIDALNGKTLTYEQQNNASLSYDDISGHAAQAQIEKLAQYGIGFAGGKFQPTAKLTELDMLVFLLSAEGWSVIAEDLTTEKTDEIYRQAYGLGILERGQRQPDRQISRGEYVKVIISMSGYGKTALLPGIYACNFADAAQIPAQLYGYAAIAQGLGLVQSGPAVQFKAAEIIDRASAAVIFHNFLDRKY